MYQNEEDMNVVKRSLGYKAREGARQMLVAALEEEVNGFLGRGPLLTGRGVPQDTATAIIAAENLRWDYRPSR